MLVLTLLAACSPDREPRTPDGGDPPTNPGQETEDRESPAPSPSPSALGPSVVINEFQAANESTWQETISWGFPDWVELYNNGTEPIDLRDLAVADATGDLWEGPDDGTLAPGERLFLTSDGLDEAWDLPFSLSSEGGDVLYLLKNGAIIDVVPVGTLGDDLAMARFPDGGDWAPTARPTPAQTNGNEPSETLDPLDQLYQPYVMHEIAVWVPADQFDEIDSRIPTDCEMSVDGVFFEHATIKNTGQGSWDSIYGKPRLVFNLDAFETGREFLGADNLELHNGKTADATRGRDWLTYGYFRAAGVPASRVGFAHLTLNEQDYGLYVLVENMDDKWIEARFPASAETGMLFEGGDFSGSLGAMDYETGPVPANPESVAAMEAADAITSGASTNGAFEQLWNYLEKDAILDYIAIEGISNHWDGYDSPHNYRWYTDGVTHRTYLVPSGVEITWTGDPELWTSNGNLADFCFDNAACSREYAEHVIAMADLFEAEDLATEYQLLFDWLRPFIAADPKKFSDMATTVAVYDISIANARNNPTEARNEIYAEYPDLMP
jgi:hypothetical protein